MKGVFLYLGLLVGLSKQVLPWKKVSMLVFVNKNKEKFVERMNVFDDKSDNLEAELGEVEQYIT